MGQVLKREYKSMRAMLVALLTTGALAALLALTGLATPSSAYAADLKGSGTADDPVLIYSTDDLITWCSNLNTMGVDAERQQHARLMDHLISDGPDGDKYGGPVTDDVLTAMNHPDLQVAELDGNSHAIELQLTSHGALFKKGGQPGDAGTTKVKNFHFIGSVGKSGTAGTLFETIGSSPYEDRKIEITDCTNQASVLSFQAAGGFIGTYFDNGGGCLIIKRCSNFGDITCTGGHAGGIAGSITQLGNKSNGSSVSYCTNDGTIKSGDAGPYKSKFGDDWLHPEANTRWFEPSAGGLVGYLCYSNNAGVNMHADYNRGDIYSGKDKGYCGGLVGYRDATNTGTPATSSYNKGSIQPKTNTPEYGGGLFGHNVAKVSRSLTLDTSVPYGSVSDTTRNGRIESDGFSSFSWKKYLDDSKYTDALRLSGVGEGKTATVTFIDPTDGYTFEQYVDWNKTTSLKTFSSSIEGHRFAYWTPDPPDEGGFWSNPPREFKSSDANDPGQRIYGDITLYAYYERSVATVEFDVNAPDGYRGSTDPASVQKTFVKGEPVGALPTATCVNYNDKSDTRAFLGWATMRDGNDPKAEWVSESSDNLYSYRDDETHTVTLYAQWAESSLPFEITRQPENYVVSAVAEGVSHEAFFDFSTTYSTSLSYGYWAQLQYRKSRNSDYKNVENLHVSNSRNQFFFDIESAKQADGDYRIKIEYHENGNTVGTVYTSSANVVMDIPQSEAEVTSIALSEYNILYDDSARDDVLGTRSYDVEFKIAYDSLQKLVGDETGETEHRAWIEGGPANTSPGDDISVPHDAGTLQYQHLVEGETYTLCVARRFPESSYDGESEPYRIPFTVPYADSIPAEIGRVLVTEEPLVKDGVVLHWPASDTHVNVNAPFNLGSNVEYERSQPDDRQVFAQWQYYIGEDLAGLPDDLWIDVPEDMFAKDEQGNPIRGVAWKDRKEARAYATLNAEAKLNGAYFRVKLSTPSAPVDTISEKSYEELKVTVPEPEITNVEVTNDTHVKVAWTWEDAAGNTKPTEGFYVSIERKDGEDKWVEVNRNRVYGNTYEVTLDPQQAQQTFRVKVKADTEGLQGSFAMQEFVTTGEVGISWEDDYATCYLPSKHKNSTISVDYDWAGYNDGKHVAEYVWYLSKDAEGGYDTFEPFATTESDSMSFPDDFKNVDLWDPSEAWWVAVEARVWYLDRWGDPDYIMEDTKMWTSALPIVHNTTEPQNLKVKDIGSHSVTVCWDAPEQGMVREYEVDLSGHKRIVRAEDGKTQYEVTIDDLLPDTFYDGLYSYVSTIDSRKAKSTIATAQYNGGEWIKTLPSPKVGTWTAAASVTEADLGDALELSAVYTPKSGKFSNGGAQLQWYSWREGDKDWQPEGKAVSLKDDSEPYTATLSHTVTSDDYGRQWKLGVKATSPDESVTGSSNVVTVSIVPPAPTEVACGATTPASIPVSWKPVADAEGYQIKCTKLDADGNPVSATTYSAAASSLTPDADGKLCYEVSGLEPSTTYQVSVAAFVHGVTGEFSAASNATTLAVPTIDVPAFQQVPKTTWVEAGKDATFTAQAGVGDGGSISYIWQRKGAGEQDFTPIAEGDKYAMSEPDGVATLTVKGVGAGQVGEFRCVATNSNNGQTVSAASTAAYLAVTPVPPTDLKSWATSPTTGEVTWTANGAVRRFVVRWQIYENGNLGPEYSKVVTIPNDTTQGSCQLDGLEPNSVYSVLIDAAPQGGFIVPGDQAFTSFLTPAASALDVATVSPDKKLVKPGETVTFEVATNEVDSSEQLEYRWQRNAFGESWFDVEGEDGAKKALAVTAPEGGSVDGYRCIVTSTRTTTGESGTVVGTDTKSVTSSVGVLLTSVPVAQPVQLTAEPDITSVHLTWENGDVRDVTYQVQYAEGLTPGDDAWIDVDNVGSGTSCDVEGLKANTAYSWRVQAVVRDELYSGWAQADAFTTLEDPSALATVSVTPRWGVAVAGSDKNITYTATTNIDNALNGETLSYQWQESATGEEWNDVSGATTDTYVADTTDAKPSSCQYRCVVTASKDGAALKTITSDAVSFTTTATPPTSLLAQDITAATADLSWTGSLVDGLTYRVFWRASGVAEWASSADLTEAKYTLNSLMPATTYEWYVQVMDNGVESVRSATALFVTQSLSPIPQLTRVVVGPVDQTPSATEQARFTAYTNVDDMTGATMDYKWEMRNLDSNPDNPTAWTTLAGKTTREIVLDKGAAGYVRCTVTYTPPTSVFTQPLANTSVTSTNEARVRVMPAAPSGLTVADISQTTAAIGCTQGASDVAFDFTYRAVGSSEWTIVQGSNSASTILDNLTPGTTYEWNVRSVAYGTSSDPLCSDWVAGPLFTTNSEDIVFSQVGVTPSATSVMAGADRTVTLTAETNADADHEQLTYQWQRYEGSDWVPVDGAQAATLQVSAKYLAVGEHTYRCEVTAKRGSLTKTLTSNESVVTVMPAAPTNLSVDGIQYVVPDNPNNRQVQATFHWTLGNAALPEGATFEVSYRKLAGAGAFLRGWTSEGLTVNNESMTCQAILEEMDLTYQWRVRVVQNGVTSPWSAVDTFITEVDQPVEELSSVLVAPSDSLVSNDDTATVTLTASTNVEDGSNLTYAWEWCELTTVNPRSSGTDWETMEGKTSKEITLSGGDRNRYVRCTVTQTVDGVGKTIASNPVCVRTEPLPPKDLSAKVLNGGGLKLSWKCDDSRVGEGKVLGTDVSYRKVGSSEWVEIPWQSYHLSGSTTLPPSSLEPDATYEWRVRTVLSNEMGQWSAGGPHTEWVDGPVFAMAKVAATPARAAAVIGNGRTLEFTAMPNDVVMNDNREKKYQWERKEGTSWASVLNATSETLSIVANDATAAGTSRYRCKVSVGSAYDVYSSEVACTLAPAAPTNLAASGITSGEAKLTWGWVQGGLQAADEFKVLYRESGARELTTATVAGNVHELSLEGLKPETVYEWRVQAVQNGVESLPSSSSLFVTASEHPALKLESVLVDPSDQTVEPGAQATVTATTNLDGMVSTGELAYTWEKRALDSKPNDPNAWIAITGQTGSSVTLPVKTSGFVRCTVTYAVNGSAVGDPVVGNEASVRVQPAADAVPTDLKVKDVGDTTTTLVWGGTLPTGGSFTLLYRPVGEEGWTTVPKAESPYTATDLAPGTTYEWRVCAVSADGVASEWVDGAKFTTTAQEAALGSVVVAPERAEAVAGDSALVEDFSAVVSGTAEGQSLAYQWQVKQGDKWTNLPAQTAAHAKLSVADLAAGEHSLRCVVTATAPGGKSKTVESNQVVLVLSPAKPSDLDVRDVQNDAATLEWTWAGPGAVDSFNVRYREEGASDSGWTTVSADTVDSANMTCAIEGLAPGTSYEWQVQAVQGGQASEWAGGGFITRSGALLKVARIWPPDVTVTADEQAKFAAFTNRGDAEGISYEWQCRALDSEDAEDSWETIPSTTGRALTLDANTTGYVRCVATQAAPSTEATEAAEIAETPETPEGADVADVAAAGASNETLGANDAPDTNETNELPAVPEASEVAETFAAQAPVVVVSNQARVRVTPSVPSGLAVGEVGFTDAALSWADGDVDDTAFTLAYRVAGSQEWTEVSGLTAPAYELDGLVQGSSYEWRVQAVVGTGDDALESEWAYGDSFTTQTIKTYQVTAGANGTWKPGEPGLAFTIDAPRDKFLSLTVDGVELVQGTDYTVSDEGMTVTLSPDYLAALEAGEHALTAAFSNGAAETTFAVAEAPQPEPEPDDPQPKPLPDSGDNPDPGNGTGTGHDSGASALAPTGDGTSYGAAALAVLSLIAAASLAFARRRAR